MIFKSKNHIKFSRKNSILFEHTQTDEGTDIVPLFVFKERFPDWDKLNENIISYLIRYMKLFPNNYSRPQIEEHNDQQGQLTLF